MIEYFIQNFSGCVWLACMLVALIPSMEAKIAIPFAMNAAIWGNSALSGLAACIFAFLGSILPGMTVIYATRFCKNKIAVRLFNSKKIAVKLEKLDSQKSAIKKYIMLAGFVAIPLPLTGVWTGSIIAGLSDLSPLKSFAAICVGALASSAIITLLCVYFSNSITAILAASVALVILCLAAQFVATIRKK